MPGPREVDVLHVLLRAIVFLSLMEAAVFAQTTLNDVHVNPREAEVVKTDASPGLLGKSSLHVIRTDVKLVLTMAPSWVTNSQE